MSDDIPEDTQRELKRFYSGKLDVFSRAVRYKWDLEDTATHWHHIDDLKPDKTNSKTDYKNHHPTNIIPIAGGLNSAIDVVRTSKTQRDIPAPLGPLPSLDDCFREGDEVSAIAKYHRQQGFRRVSYGCYRTAAFFHFNRVRALFDTDRRDDARNLAMFYSTRALEQLIQEKDVGFATDTLFRNILPLVHEASADLTGPIAKWPFRPEVIATLATDISDHYKLSQDECRAAKWTWFARLLTQKKCDSDVRLEPLITRLDYHTAEQMLNMLQRDSMAAHQTLAPSHRTTLIRFADDLLARSITALSTPDNPLGRLANSADVIALLLERPSPAIAEAKDIANLGGKLSSRSSRLITRKGDRFSQDETFSSGLTNGLMKAEIELMARKGSIADEDLKNALEAYKALSMNGISSVGVDTNLRIVRLLESKHISQLGTLSIIPWRSPKDLSTPVSIGTMDSKKRSFDEVAESLWTLLSAIDPAMHHKNILPFEYLTSRLAEPYPFGFDDTAYGQMLSLSRVLENVETVPEIKTSG